MDNQNTSNETKPCSQDIIKVLDKKNLIISILITIVGIATFAMTFMIEEQDGTLPLAFMTGGCAVALYGIFRCLGKSYKEVYKLTGSSIKEYSLYFEEKYLKTLQNGICNHEFPADATPIQSDNATVRLDILLSNDRQFAQLQLFHYENYIFHPVTDIYCYHSPDVVKVVDLIKRKKK